MTVAYPITGENGGSGRVASAQRITSVSTGGLPGIRLTVGAGGVGNVYEIFFDAYLRKIAANGDFQYVYTYWYREVKQQYPGGPWYPVSTSKPRIISSSMSQITTVLGQTLPTSLLIESTKRPANLSGVSPTPGNYGWQGTGQGTQVGTTYQGPGNAGFQGPNPFGYQPDKNSGEDGSGSGTAGGETGGGGASGNASDDPYRNEGPPIPGFDKKRKTYFNPPPVRSITGAYVPVVYDWQGNKVSVDDVESATDTRDSLLGSGSYAQRLSKKATIVQWIEIDDEWRVGSGGSATDQNGKVTDTWSADQPLVPNGIRYGFRFMYNPSEVQFQMSPIQGIDPGVIISGLGRSYPMGDEDGGSISLTTHLNRIEDMAFLRKKKKGYDFSTGVSPYGNRTLSTDDKTGIATRGTGYDLEYLFRTSLGKPFPTKTRGVTADIGLILGLPLLITLGGGMSYTGRLTGLAYTHMFFTSDMVPTYTQVSMTFTRFPDATSFNENPKPGGKGNDKPRKKR